MNMWLPMEVKSTVEVAPTVRMVPHVVLNSAVEVAPTKKTPTVLPSALQEPAVFTEPPMEMAEPHAEPQAGVLQRRRQRRARRGAGEAGTPNSEPIAGNKGPPLSRFVDKEVMPRAVRKGPPKEEGVPSAAKKGPPAAVPRETEEEVPIEVNKGLLPVALPLPEALPLPLVAMEVVEAPVPE